MAVGDPLAVAYDAPSPAWFAEVTHLDVGPAPMLARPAAASQWIVRLKPEAVATTAGPAYISSQLNAGADGTFQVVRGLGLPGQLLVESSASAADAAAALAANRHVASFGPNSKYFGTRTPNDPRFDEQVGLKNDGQAGDDPYRPDIDVETAWETSIGDRDDVVVAVLDTGIAYDHPDLISNIWTNETERLGTPGVDDDLNGFEDDIYGWNFVVDDIQENDSDPYDDNGHGTHVAGTIGAVGDNDLGVSGVAWETSLMAVKVLDANNEGLVSGIIAGVNYATMMRQGDVSKGRDPVPVKVLNASFGNYAFDTSLLNALQLADSAGILVVAAAGNGLDGVSGVDTDFRPFYPASYDLDNIIAVAAVDSSDRLAPFSNFGRNSVDLAAPGMSVLSTSVCSTGPCYAFNNGTSMAAPHVSGVATLIWSSFPPASLAEVREAILKGVDHPAELQGLLAAGGRLNAGNALNIDTIAPRATLMPIPDVEQAGVTALFIRVVYKDNHLIDNPTLELSSLKVARLGNSAWEADATYFAKSTNRDAATIEVTYKLTPPGGSWDETDNGFYEVRQPALRVFDRGGNSVAASLLGTWFVNVDEPGVFRVDSLLDLPDANLEDLLPRAAGGFVTLRAAVQQANRNGGATKIILPAITSASKTTFVLTIPGMQEDAAARGDLDISSDITILGEGLAATMIDGGLLDRVFDVRPGGDLHLEELTVTRGRTSSTVVSDRDGGGVRNAGTLGLSSVIIRDSEAHRGGGIYNAPGARLANIRSSSFVLNTARDSGGAIFNATEVNGARPALDTLQAVGGEAPVNSSNALRQDLPAVAMDSSGNTLVVWQGFEAGDSGAIYARRFNALGAPMGAPFVVNASSNERLQPAVAMDRDGNAVIAWQGFGADGAGWGIHVRRMSANGVFDPAGEFVPYLDPAGHQTSPQVAIGEAGRFIITWNGAGAGDSDGVFARFYDGQGAVVANVLANSTTARRQTGGLAAWGANGEALIVWSAEGADGRHTIRGQRFSNTGARQGDEIAIASDVGGSLFATSLIATRQGYAVAWTRTSADELTGNVQFRRLDALGNPWGAVEPLSSAPTAMERGANLSALDDGGWVATFASLERDGSGWGVYARQFDDQGAARSTEFRVNSTTTGSQSNPRVASNESGRVSIVWNGKGPSDVNGIFQQRFEASYDEDSVFATASLKLENVTLSGNHAVNEGGALFNAGNAVTAIRHATIAWNVLASTGGSGGVFGDEGGTLAVKSSLIVGNGNSSSIVDLGGQIASLGYNLVGNRADSDGYGRGSDLPDDLTAASHLLPLPDNGPLVHELLSTSKAIDAADPAQTLDSDQLGLPRPQDGDGDGLLEPDIGAVERYYSELRGVRYHDRDGDGVRDAGDPGLPGLVVYLDDNRNGIRDANETFVITDDNGNFIFRDRPPGRHIVATESQSGWKRTAPSWLIPADEPRLSAAPNPVDQVAVDVDGDGDVDLVALESNPDAALDRLIVFLNKGFGNFADPVYVATNVSWTSIILASGDVDNDSDVDFVVAHAASSGSLTLLRNRGDGTFDPPQQIVSNRPFPSAPLLVQLDADNFLDLVWLEPGAGENSAWLRVALNNGSGAFPNSTPFALGGLSEVIVAGNFNANSQGQAIDLIVGRDLLLNRGNGEFEPRQDTNLIDAVTPYLSTDLNGDGHLDVVGLQRAAREFGVLVNNQIGGFIEQSPVALPGLPQDVTLADWDGDGDLDAAVTISDMAHVVLIMNVGDGAFQLEPNSQLTLPGTRPLNLAVGDVNADGFRDLSVTLDNGQGLAVFENTRGQRRVDLYAGEIATGVAFGELALRAEIRGRVFHDLDQDGFFGGAPESTLQDRRVYVDLNENGVLDASPVSYEGAMVLEPSDDSDGQGNYVLSGLAPLPRRPYKVRLAGRSSWLQTSPRAYQFNSEYVVAPGASEVIMGLDFGTYNVTIGGAGVNGTIKGTFYHDGNSDGRFNAGERVLENQLVYLDTDRSGTFTPGEATDSTDNAGRYEFIAVPGGVHAVRPLFSGLDDWTTTDPLGNRFAVASTDVGAAPQAVALFDFDDDGDLDVATPNALTNNVSILRNDGGVLTHLGTIAADALIARGPASIATGDLDGKFGDDIAVANLFGSTISVFLSDGSGWFVLGGIYEVGYAPTAIAAGYFNRDPDPNNQYLDLAVAYKDQADPSKGKLRILHNDGFGAFPNLPNNVTIDVGDAPRAVTAVQLGEDDDFHELIVANHGSNSVTVLRNATGQFTDIRTLFTGRGPAMVTTADLNGDGKSEIITGNRLDSSVTVLWNNGFQEFTARDDLPLGAAPSSLAVVDLDLDRDYDILVTTPFSDQPFGDLNVLRNRQKQQTSRGFAAVETVSSGVARLGASEHLSVAAGDMNKDALPDVVIANGWQNKVRLLTNERVDGAHFVALTGDDDVVTLNIGVRLTSAPPTLDFIDDQQVYEDEGPAFVELTGITAGEGEPQQPLVVSVSSGDPDLIDPSVLDFNRATGTARIRYEPKPNQWGAAAITVTLTDGGGDNNLITTVDNGVFTRTFTIAVHQVNDRPVFALGSDTVTVNEGEAYAKPFGAFVSYGPSDPPQGPLEYLIEVENRSLFAVQPAFDSEGTLRFVGADNKHGSTDVHVRAKDQGGTDRNGLDISLSQTFTIIISEVNDPPTFVMERVLASTSEDAGLGVIPAWITAISPGEEESAQTVRFEVRTTNAALFEGALPPVIDANGTLRFQAKLDAYGTAEVFVRAVDNGAGEASSEEQRFVIQVDEVNDPPSFTVGPHVLALVNSGEHSIPNWATDIRVGPADESAKQSYFFSTIGVDNPQLFADELNPPVAGKSSKPKVLADGTLIFKLRTGMIGAATVTLAMFETGVTDPGFVLTTFRITASHGLVGDTNEDRKVDLEDLNRVRNNFGAGSSNGPPVAGEAFPYDGVVDLADLNAVRNQFGATISAPPPARSFATEQPLRARAADLLFQIWGAEINKSSRQDKGRALSRSAH